jgi:hypothetical protein
LLPKLEPNLTLKTESPIDMDTNMMNGAKELGLMKPKPFTGKRSKVENFLEDCDVYLELNNKVYDTDAKKIGFVLSLMDSDEVLLWK